MSEQGKSTTPQGGGRRPYLEVVQERRDALLQVDRLTGERDRALTDKMAEEQKVAQLMDALEKAHVAFEGALEKATAEVPAGALKFGCAHPYSEFPRDFSGTIVTDGDWWYCSFNHLRVGIQTRAGLT